MTATFDELRGRLVLVTGGGSGIGAGVAQAFLAQGARVVSADLSFRAPESASRASDAAGASGADSDARIMPVSDGLWHVGLDVSDPDEIARVVTAVTAELGVIDTVVNAAGTSTMDFAVDTKASDWDRNLDVNARGSFLVAQAVAQQLVERELPGRIIFIASQAGKNGYRAMTAYVASKHAVMGVTKSMAVELAPRGITVNAICPGIIETPMKHRERIQGGAIRGMTADEVAAEDRSQVPLGRTGEVSDVAGVALFLASDLASYMTGQGINVTGGMTMH